MNDYTFTIVIPTHNEEKYIAKCIKAVRRAEKMFRMIMFRYLLSLTDVPTGQKRSPGNTEQMLYTTVTNA